MIRDKLFISISNNRDIEYLAEEAENAMYAYEMALDYMYEASDTVALEAKAQANPQSWWQSVKNALNTFIKAVQDVVGRALRSLRLNAVRREAADLRQRAKNINAAKIAGVGGAIALALTIGAGAYKILKDSNGIANKIRDSLKYIQDIANAAIGQSGTFLQKALGFVGDLVGGKANEAVVFEAEGDNNADETLQKAQANQANAEQQVQMSVEELKTFADNVGGAVEALANGMTNVNNMLNKVINERSSEKMRDFQKGVSKIFDWGLKIVREPTKILRGVVGKLEAATAAPGEGAQVAQNNQPQENTQNNEQKE